MNLSCLNIIYCAKYLQAFFLIMANNLARLNRFNTMTDITAARFIRIVGVSDRFFDLVRYKTYIPLRVMGYGGIYRTAMRVSENNDQLHPQVVCGVFDTAELMIIDHIAGDSNHEQISDPYLKNRFRNNSGIRAGNDQRKRLLPVHTGISADCGRNISYFVLHLQVSSISFFKPFHTVAT